MSDQKEDQIRVSCSSLVKIELEEKILLTINLERAKKGIIVYTPVGGVLAADEEGESYLTNELGCHFNGRDRDLRLMINAGQLPRFEEWFFSYKNREISPYRELSEELVNEEGIFDSLPQSEFKVLEKRMNVEERKITDKPGNEGQLTQRYFEIWTLQFSDVYNEILRGKLTEENIRAYAATEKEIRGLRTDRNEEIRDNSLALILNPTTTPSRKIQSGGEVIKLYLNE